MTSSLVSRVSMLGWGLRCVLLKIFSVEESYIMPICIPIAASSNPQTKLDCLSSQTMYYYFPRSSEEGESAKTQD